MRLPDEGVLLLVDDGFVRVESWVTIRAQDDRIATGAKWPDAPARPADRLPWGRAVPAAVVPVGVASP